MAEKFACSDCNYVLDDIRDSECCSNCGATWDKEIPPVSFSRKVIAVLAAFGATIGVFIIIIFLGALLGKLFMIDNRSSSDNNIIGKMLGAGIVALLIVTFKITYSTVKGEEPPEQDDNS